MECVIQLEESEIVNNEIGKNEMGSKEFLNIVLSIEDFIF